MVPGMRCPLDRCVLYLSASLSQGCIEEKKECKEAGDNPGGCYFSRTAALRLEQEEPSCERWVPQNSGKDPAISRL